LTGKRFGNITVVAFSGVDKTGHSTYLCRDDEGREKVISGTSVSRGRTKGIVFRGKHGHAVHVGENGSYKSLTYRSWMNMKTRCQNPNQMFFYIYGKVSICDPWLGERGFENFRADMGDRPAGTSLGRFGDLGNYESTNCAWQTPEEQKLEGRLKRSAADANLIVKYLVKVRRNYYKSYVPAAA
jgi:hypothetical protein